MGEHKNHQGAPGLATATALTPGIFLLTGFLILAESQNQVIFLKEEFLPAADVRLLLDGFFTLCFHKHIRDFYCTG